MQNIRVKAVRKDGVIRVVIWGDLEDTCQVAKIVDYYPGGDIHFVRDPGEAQVYIEQGIKPGSEICLDMLVPWTGTQYIEDKEHRTVAVFINKERVFVAPVIDQPNRWMVIALTGTGTGCRIIPEGSVYPAIYSQVFGPDTYAACEAWVAANCGARVREFGLVAALSDGDVNEGDGTLKAEELEATGTGLTFDAAFWDAVENLPPSRVTHPDAMTSIRVTGMGATLGGLAGFMELWVSIKATTL